MFIASRQGIIRISTGPLVVCFHDGFDTDNFNSYNSIYYAHWVGGIIYEVIVNMHKEGYVICA